MRVTQLKLWFQQGTSKKTMEVICSGNNYKYGLKGVYKIGSRRLHSQKLRLQTIHMGILLQNNKQEKK